MTSRSFQDEISGFFKCMKIAILRTWAKKLGLMLVFTISEWCMSREMMDAVFHQQRVGCPCLPGTSVLHAFFRRSDCQMGNKCGLAHKRHANHSPVNENVYTGRCL